MLATRGSLLLTTETASRVETKLEVRCRAFKRSISSVVKPKASLLIVGIFGFWEWDMRFFRLAEEL